MFIFLITLYYLIPSGYSLAQKVGTLSEKNSVFLKLKIYTIRYKVRILSALLLFLLMISKLYENHLLYFAAKPSTYQIDLNKSLSRKVVCARKHLDLT